MTNRDKFNIEIKLFNGKMLWQFSYLRISVQIIKYNKLRSLRYPYNNLSYTDIEIFNKIVDQR